jgi:hypothetical protein
MVGLEDVVVFYVRFSFYSERLVLSRLRGDIMEFQLQSMLHLMTSTNHEANPNYRYNCNS